MIMITTDRTRIAALTLAAVAVFTFAGGGAAQASPAIPLTTGQETPAPSNGGAHGFFSYEIGEGELCYTLEVKGLTTPAVAAHVHLGPGTSRDPSSCRSSSRTTRASRSTPACRQTKQCSTRSRTNPGAYYINVHTSMNTPGEVRGQLK